jgi:hypothetical protein
MGIQSMSIIENALGNTENAKKYRELAEYMAESWKKRAYNDDGSTRLTFDAPNTFSMKYNMVWDKIWGTGLFPEEVYKAEIDSNFSRFKTYGMPLDSRCDQTKSDWLVWTATMAETKEDFERFILPLWRFYNETPDRIPMSDWYDTVSGCYIGFIHRTVQGGLFIKMLDESKKLKIK